MDIPVFKDRRLNAIFFEKACVCHPQGVLVGCRLFYPSTGARWLLTGGVSYGMHCRSTPNVFTEYLIPEILVSFFDIVAKLFSTTENHCWHNVSSDCKPVNSQAYKREDLIE